MGYICSDLRSSTPNTPVVIKQNNMNLYISNLGEQITDESLRAIFATYGVVHSAEIAKDQFTGYSRGFAFIEMPNEDEALAAIVRLNGSVLNGRSVSVEKAEARRGYTSQIHMTQRSPKP
jgi:RNA recognition motif-containing protein